MKRNGLYFEVNCFNKINNYHINQSPLPNQFKELGMPLRFHNDDLESHIKKLVSSKYFKIWR